MTESLTTASPTEKKFEFRGDLVQMPLPEVLETINRYRVPGVLDCTQAGWNRKIFLQGGELTFATSNNLTDSLGDFLLRKERISRLQYDESVVRLKQTRQRQGVVLVEMGVLTAKELFATVVDQVKEIVWDTFNWESGEVTFSVGKFKEDEIIQLHIPARSAILRGVTAMKDTRRLVSRMGTSWSIWEPTWDATELVELGMLPPESRLLEAVDGKKSLVDLTKEGSLGQAENARLLYAFSCLKLIRRKEDRAIRVQYRTTGGQMSAE